MPALKPSTSQLHGAARYRYSCFTLSTNKQAAGVQAGKRAGIQTGNSIAGIRQDRRQAGWIGKATGRQADKQTGN